MPPTATFSILFATEAAANYPVAGIPAAARAIARASMIEEGAAIAEPILIGVPGGWIPSALCVAETERLAPAMRWSAANASSETAVSWVSGGDLQYLADGAPPPVAEDLSSIEPTNVEELRRQAKRIIASTGKAGDGIVSRHINRPISQAITRVLLRWPCARPWHATLAAAIIGIAMFAALLFGGGAGLLIGATLFQLASIVDGVDGEIARATFRTSARGAMMDSATDAATNLGFIGGVSYNLYIGGAQQPGIAGAFGFTILALGSALLGWQSRRDGGPLTFDALKTRFRQRPSRAKQWLTYITMRDFYAFAAFLAVLAGLASYLLFTFAAVATGWFVVLCWTLLGLAKQQEGA